MLRHGNGGEWGKVPPLQPRGLNEQAQAGCAPLRPQSSRGKPTPSSHPLHRPFPELGPTLPKCKPKLVCECARQHRATPGGPAPVVTSAQCGAASRACLTIQGTTHRPGYCRQPQTMQRPTALPTTGMGRGRRTRTPVGGGAPGRLLGDKS